MYQQDYPISTLCRVLQVSVSGDYAWRQRAPSRGSREDGMLTERISPISQANRQVSGSPRLHAALRANGQACGKKRVARLMRSCGREPRNHAVIAPGPPTASTSIPLLKMW